MDDNARFKFNFSLIFGANGEDFSCLTKNGYAVELSTVDFAIAKKDGKTYMVMKILDKPNCYGLARQAYEKSREVKP